MAKKSKAVPCQWISGLEAFKAFATHTGKTESAGHIKPLHWYIACRLVLEGGFHPDDIKPRPPFVVTQVKRKKRTFHRLTFDPAVGGTGEQTILGGLKTKNVDVVVTRDGVGPVLAVSCKGVTKAFRNLTNRMEETIGECTNLHITYPAMVVGYFALLRANRTIEDVLEAPELEKDEPAEAEEDAEQDEPREPPKTLAAVEKLKANDIAILDSGDVSEGIRRFHDALREMSQRRGIRDEISRYEAIGLALIEPKGLRPGSVTDTFPEASSVLHISKFFATLYRRYEERFVLGAPLLVDRGKTIRYEWDPESEIFARTTPEARDWPEIDFDPRLASST